MPRPQNGNIRHSQAPTSVDENPMANAPRLTFNNGVRYVQDGQVLWEMALEDIVLVGESTNSGGPGGRDHTYCIINSSGTWFDASVHAEGVTDAMAALGKALDTKLAFTLTASRAFQSRVFWPPHFAGKPMFTFTVTKPQGFFAKLLKSDQIEQRLTDDVSQFVDQVCEAELAMQDYLEKDEGDDDDDDALTDGDGPPNVKRRE